MPFDSNQKKLERQMDATIDTLADKNVINPNEAGNLKDGIKPPKQNPSTALQQEEKEEEMATDEQIKRVEELEEEIKKLEKKHWWKFW